MGTTLMEGCRSPLHRIAGSCTVEEVDHQFVFGRCLHRKVCGFCALEDAIDVAGRAPALVHKIRAVGNEATGGDHVMKWVDRRQFVPSRECNDQVTRTYLKIVSRSRSAITVG